MKTTIYLIRHSEALKVKEEPSTSKIDQIKNEKLTLSEKGKVLAQKLSCTNELQNIDMLFSSNYVRAVSTAKYIADKNDIEINIDDRLGERKLR